MLVLFKLRGEGKILEQRRVLPKIRKKCTWFPDIFKCRLYSHTHKAFILILMQDARANSSLRHLKDYAFLQFVSIPLLFSSP